MDANLQVQQETFISEAIPTDLSPEDIYRNDPLLKFFKGRLKMKNSWIVIIEIVLTLGCFYGLYIFPGNQFGIVSNTIFAALEIFTASLFYLVYLWLPDAVVFLFNKLKNNDVIGPALPGQTSSPSYTIFLKELVTCMNYRRWIVGTLGFVVLYLLNRFLVRGAPFLSPVPLWLQIITAFVDGFIAYISIISVIRLILALVFVNRLFNSFIIHVSPLHPDGAGGLGSMRRVVWVSIVIILATTLTFLETTQISNSNHIAYSAIDTSILVIAYLVLTPSIVMGWLALPHKAMVQSRNELLEPLSKEFRQIAEKSSSMLTSNETETVVAYTDRLSAIKKRYDLLRDTFPTWPLELKQIPSLLAALSLPALLPLFPYIADTFKIISDYLAHHPLG